MSYKVLAIKPFDKQLKRLAKKFPSLKKEIFELFEILENDPRYGTQIGNNCYKIRLSIASKRKGKSGGARIITYVQVINTSVYLLSIYDKSEMENITDKELSVLINEI